MDIIAKDAVSVISREMADGHVVFVRRPHPALAADNDFMDIFRTEAERIEGLSLPTLLRFDEWREGAWIMKVAPGFISLFDALTKRPAAMCAPKTIQTIARAIIDHLDYLHRHGMWMVQLSAHNVMVNPSTLQIRILPPLSPYLELKNNIFAGQPGIAPEVETPSEISVRTDFYGLAHLLGKFQQFSPLPRSLNIIQSECSQEDQALRIGNTTEMLRILDKADKGNKALPYLIGAGGFAVLLAMFLLVGGDDELPNPDARYIEPEKHQPSPEGVPDSTNLIIEQYKQYLHDSLKIDDDIIGTGTYEEAW